MINRSLAIGFDPFVTIRRVIIQCVMDHVDSGCDQLDPSMIDLMITAPLSEPLKPCRCLNIGKVDQSFSCNVGMYAIYISNLSGHRAPLRSLHTGMLPGCSDLVEQK